MKKYTCFIFFQFRRLYTFNPLKGLYFYPREVISGLTDKGQIKSISVFHWIKEASRGDLPVLYKISFTKLNINILSEIPKHIMGPLYYLCKKVIITS